MRIKQFQLRKMAMLKEKESSLKFLYWELKRGGVSDPPPTPNREKYAPYIKGEGQGEEGNGKEGGWGVRARGACIISYLRAPGMKLRHC